MIKIKVNPEDFIVEEVAGLPMRKNGNYYVYRLTKRGWNTVDVLRRISQTYSIPFPDFSYGNKKVILNFFLPKACYGTMSIKRIFC